MGIIVVKTVLCYGPFAVALSTMTYVRTRSETMGAGMHGRFTWKILPVLVESFSELKALRGTQISDHFIQTPDNR